ncbi:MAG: hypothetical protein PHO30_06405, partial [Candidatus Omnitrophica bacterium]|nr:hypothetical protein [Candidatus Omnitrophota bacterium]
MKKGIRYYSYIVVVCFLVNILTTNVGLAFDLQAQQDMLMSDDVLKTVFGDQISTQSDSTNLTDATIATPAKVITTSNGDVYIYSSQGVSAQVSTTKTGETTVTYSMNGANVRIKNEDTGEEFTYQYQIDGAQINLVNSLGVVVETRSVDSFGNTTSLSNQGTIEYVYSDDGLNKIVKSIDQWGNVTVYDSLGRPDYIMYIDSDGSEVMIGDYTFNSKGILESFVDHNGSTTYFESDGIRPAYTTNAQGAITQVYEYDSDNHLISVLEYAGGTDPTKQTIVEDGYYTVMFDLTPVLDEEGNPVLDASGEATFTQTLIGAYNYDEAGHISSVTQIGSGSTVTGWTEYDEWGQVIGQYNQEGVLVTEYVYNERGFLQQTISLGGVDSLTGQQVQLSYTLFDKQGRPAEVWQLGDGSNKVKSQTYEYNGEGFLESTFTYGILRGTDENNTATYNKPVDSAGNLVTDGHFTYITPPQATFDKKGRPQTVYGIARDSAGNAMLDEEGNVVLEKQQSYVYS